MITNLNIQLKQITQNINYNKFLYHKKIHNKQFISFKVNNLHTHFLMKENKNFIKK